MIDIIGTPYMVTASGAVKHIPDIDRHLTALCGRKVESEFGDYSVNRHQRGWAKVCEKCRKRAQRAK